MFLSLSSPQSSRVEWRGGNDDEYFIAHITRHRAAAENKDWPITRQQLLCDSLTLNSQRAFIKLASSSSVLFALSLPSFMPHPTLVARRPVAYCDASNKRHFRPLLPSLSRDSSGTIAQQFGTAMRFV